MSKRISDQQVIGEQGIALIYSHVTAMGFLWYPSGGTEAGIDGTIELRDGRTGVVTNQIVQVQSRATNRQFAAETETSFEYLCSERDLGYWLGGNAPVILVRSRPKTGEAYWVSLKEYFAEPGRRAARKVVFDKRRDRFDADCGPRLAAVARPRESGIYVAALPKRERLVSNLLEVVEGPRRIYIGETEFRHGGALAAALRLEGQPAGREWFLRRGRLVSIHNLAEPPFGAVCDRGTVECFEASEWATADDPTLEAEYAELLYACLAGKTGRMLRYLGSEKLFYARPGRDLDVRRLGARSGRRRGRIVFRAYESKQRAGQIGFCKHWAFHAHFCRYGDTWYLELEPTYHFTLDGYRRSRYAGDYLANAKRLERNDAVRQLVQMWARYLQGVGSLLDAPYEHLVFGELATFDVSAGVEDDVWLDAARRIPEAADTPGDERLFA